MRRLLILCLVALPATGFAFGKNAPGMFTESENALPADQIRPMRYKSDEPVTLEAAEMGYDQEHAVVVARGKVEVAQGAYVLTADQITYYQNRNLVVAEGNVTLLQPSGDVYFAERAELHDNMKTGVVQAFKARLADNSVFVAQQAVKVSPNVTKLKNAAYTPCNLCEGAAPFWQLDAGKVKLNELEEKVRYQDVTLDMFGVPVVYTPYLSHPTPGAAGKSGFLMPTYANDSNLGTVVKTPYYWRINEDKDMVLTPWISSDQGTLLEGNYRQLTDQGSYSVRASATNPQRLDSNGNEIDGNEFRGAIFAQGTEELEDNSRIGFDLQRTTDDTYLRRYGFGSQSALFSRGYAETATGRNYALAQAIWIQGLRATDNPDTTPLVLPSLEGYYETRPDDHGIRWHVGGDAQSLTRDLGVDQNRMSMTVGASKPYVTEGGHVLTSMVNFRQDVYSSRNVPITGGTSEFDGETLRSLPQAALEWRYPLIKPMEGGAWAVEPILLAVAQTNGGNPDEIANEDNKLIELSDTNLFSLNRMPGLDTVDSGPRLAYGFRTQYMMARGTSFDALFGQDYNVNDETPFPNSTKPGENFSDYIGRVGMQVAPFSAAYRYALDNETLSPHRHEVQLGFAKPWFSIATSYRLLDDSQYVENSEEGAFSATLPLGEQWSIYGGAARDFDLGRMVSSNMGIVYKNECFNVILDGLRNYATDRDVQRDTQISLRIGFKNLGEFGGN